MNIDEFTGKLVGKACRAVVFGAGTGSVVGLGFGDRLRRVKPLSNPRLREIDRIYSSELELTVYCTWRLCRESRVICGWRDGFDQPGIAELEGLDGKKVIDAAVQKETYDLEIEFEGNIKFQIFCDVTNDHDVNDNYLFANAEEIGAVGVNSKIAQVEKRVRSLRAIE
jgi:hypothetical protein